MVCRQFSLSHCYIIWFLCIILGQFWQHIFAWFSFLPPVCYACLASSSSSFPKQVIVSRCVHQSSSKYMIKSANLCMLSYLIQLVRLMSANCLLVGVNRNLKTLCDYVKDQCLIWQFAKLKIYQQTLFVLFVVQTENSTHYRQSAVIKLGHPCMQNCTFLLCLCPA